MEERREQGEPDPWVLAARYGAAMLPGIFLSPFAGALVDRWSRRTVMIVADGLIALVAAWVVKLRAADIPVPSDDEGNFLISWFELPELAEETDFETFFAKAPKMNCWCKCRA